MPELCESGMLDVTRVDHPVTGYAIYVSRADPIVWFTPEFLAEIPPPLSEWPVTFDGEMLRIRGVNRTVIYRIGTVLESDPRHPDCGYYVGEWPD